MSENEEELAHYLDLLDEEVARLRLALPAAVEVQWEAPPAPEQARRRAGSAVADPTGNTASDSARLQLRYQLRCSAPLLKNAVINVRGVRRGLERRLSPYGGVTEVTSN